MSEDKLKFWDERAHLSDLAGSNDFGIKNFEMSTLDKFIEDGMKVLDLDVAVVRLHFILQKIKILTLLV